MSEALHHKEMNTPDKLAPVIPMPLNRETHETIDFSEAPPDYVADFLMSELNHPGRSQHTGEELVRDIEKLIPAKAERELDKTTLEGRLVEIVQQKNLGDTDIYDHKIDHDAVFQELAEKLLYARDRRDLRPVFEATRNLAHLRSALSDETSRDKEWQLVIDRLFS